MPRPDEIVGGVPSGPIKQQRPGRRAGAISSMCRCITWCRPKHRKYGSYDPCRADGAEPLASAASRHRASGLVDLAGSASILSAAQICSAASAEEVSGPRTPRARSEDS